MTTKKEPTPILGRMPCPLFPLCDNQAGHVKRNPGKRPHFHCPQCGVLFPCRNGDQEAKLLAKMRPEGTPPAPPKTDDPITVPAPAAAPPAPAGEPPAPPRRPGLFEQLAGKVK